MTGGAFTTRVTWRWCFFINLPIGAITLVIIAFILSPSIGATSTKLEDKKWWQVLLRLDPIGTVILLPSIICLILALQWGGTLYPWSSPRVIATLIVFGVTAIAWTWFQYSQGDEATVPMSVLGNRSVAGATVYTLLSSGAFTIVVYYLPLW
jgi:hypothetical protein